MNGPGYTIEGEVLLSEGGVAYLIGGNHSVLKYVNGELKPSQASMRNFAANLVRRRRRADNAGAVYAHVIFPDKQSVLTEDFPFRPVHRLGDAYAAATSEESQAHLIYPADALRAAPIRAFHPLDTHMTDHGSTHVLRMMLERVAIEADRALARIETSITREARWRGDLGSKFNPPLYQEGLLLNADWPLIQVCSPGGCNDGMIDVLFSPTAEIDKTVLLFGDSFFRMMLKHLSAVFTRVICLRTRFMHSEMVTLISPDVIFTGNAERYLAHVSPDRDAHAFMLYPQLRGNAEQVEDKEFLAAWRAVTSPDSGFAQKYFSDNGLSARAPK